MYGSGGSTAANQRWDEAKVGIAVNTANAVTATEQANKRIEDAVGRIHSAIDRVRSFADRQSGERGMPVGLPEKDAPRRSGRMGALTDGLDVVHASLSTLESELERLHEI